MANTTHLKAVITAQDRMSPTLKKITQNLGAWERQLKAAGKWAIPMGASLAAGMGVATKAFSSAENAAKQLENTMMEAGGKVPAQFEKIAAQATKLGATLPGSTADFEKMAASLRGLGLANESIANGALEATAKLGVVGKGLGETYESAAEGVAKFSNSLAIADKDLVPFADTVQRALHLGVGITEMQYALARVAPPLKAMGQSGLKAANDVVPLVAMLQRAGMSGEEAGTGIKRMIEVFAEHKKFTNIPQMVKDLEKLYKLDPKNALTLFGEIFGKEQAAKAVEIAMGGYTKTKKEMAAQASLNDRVNNSLDSLTSKTENLGGNFENLAASLGKILSPQLKATLDGLADFAAKTDTWAKQNPRTVKTLIAVAAALTGVQVAAMAASYGLAALRVVALTSPMGLLISAIAAGAALIITNWDKIAPYFDAIWQRIQKGWQVVSDDWNNMINGLPKLWEDAKDAVFGVWDAMGRRWDEIVSGWRSGMDWVRNLFGLAPSSAGGSAAMPAMPADISGLANATAAAQGVDPALVRSIIAAESGGNAKAFSNKGAAGLMQLMPATADRFGVVNRFDPAQNIMGGTKYLRYLLNRYHGDEAKAIAAYNAGEGNVDKYGGVPPFAETRAYTDKVLGYLKRERMQGGIDVNFNNAPAGTRVEPQKGNINIKPKVGYRSLGPVYG